MTDWLIAPLNAVATQFSGASQMDIAGFARALIRQVLPTSVCKQAGIGTCAPEPRRTPVIGIFVVSVIIEFVLAGHGLSDVDARAILYFGLRQCQVKLLLRPVNLTKGDRSDEYLPPIQRGVSLYDEVANYPMRGI